MANRPTELLNLQGISQTEAKWLGVDGDNQGALQLQILPTAKDGVELLEDNQGYLKGVAYTLLAGVTVGALDRTVGHALGNGLASADNGQPQGFMGGDHLDKLAALAVLATGPLFVGIGNAYRTYYTRNNGLKQLQGVIDEERDSLYDLDQGIGDEALQKEYIQSAIGQKQQPTSEGFARYKAEFEANLPEIIKEQEKKIGELEREKWMKRAKLPVEVAGEFAQGVMAITGLEAFIFYVGKGYSKDVLQAAQAGDTEGLAALVAIGAGFLYMGYSGVKEMFALQAPMGASEARSQAAIARLKGEGKLGRQAREKGKRPGFFGRLWEQAKTFATRPLQSQEPAAASSTASSRKPRMKVNVKRDF